MFSDFSVVWINIRVDKGHGGAYTKAQLSFHETPHQGLSHAACVLTYSETENDIPNSIPTVPSIPELNSTPLDKCEKKPLSFFKGVLVYFIFEILI